MSGKKEEYLNLLSVVASLYYEYDLSQAEIADQICLSRSRVSRLLTKARELEIVTFSVKKYGTRNEEIEGILERNFGLKKAIVVNTEPEDAEADTLAEKVTLGAAKYIQSLLHPGETIGTTWGSAVAGTINYLEAQPELELDVVQIIGGSLTKADNLNQIEIFMSMLKKFGGNAFLLNAPIYITDRQAHYTITNQGDTAETIKKAKSSDMIITGIGVSSPKNHMIWDAKEVGILNDENFDMNRADGYICGQSFDVHGNETNRAFNSQVVGLHLTDLKKIPVSIGIAYGKEKVKGILGAIRGGFVNTLVTDSSCALEVLNMAKE